MAEAAMEAIARAKAIAAKLNMNLDSGGTKKRGRWGDGGPEDDASRKRKKVYIPRDNPEINFMGLLIGPRGSTQKRMEEQSGARIVIRGRGSQKEGEEPGSHPDDSDDLHVAIEGSDEAIEIATKEVEAILFNPQEAMRLKQAQLRNLAEMNGTLRSDGGADGHYGPNGGGGGGGGPMGGMGGGAPRPKPGLGFGDGHYGPEEEMEDVRVPGNIVGLIIGKGGENIQRMQQTTGCHVQIAKEYNPEPGDTMRTVNLKGSRQGIEECKKLIDELVQSRQQGGDRRDSRGPLPPADPSQYGCSSSIQIQVPNDKVGLIIGRGGSTIKSIQEKTGAHIQIPQQQDGEDPNFRTISVSASNHEAAAAAEAEINSILSGQRREPTAPQQIVMHVPNDRIGFIIGKGGATIKDIQARTRTRIQIPTDVEPNTDPPMRVVNISGVGDAPQQARMEIEAMCAGDRNGPHGGDRYGGGPHGGPHGGPGGYGGYNQPPPYGHMAPPMHGYYPPQHGYYPQYPGYADPYAAAAAAYYGYGQPMPGAHPQQPPAPGGEAPSTEAAGEVKPKAEEDKAGTAATAAAPAPASGADPTAYHDGYWQWAAVYGEEYARSMYGGWAPPPGTAPPPGITIPTNPPPPPASTPAPAPSS